MPEEIHQKQEKAPDLHILVVEDNPVNQMVMGKLLRKIGCTCVLAGNGLQALENLEQEAFDMLLTDVSMPEMDGLEVSRKIRASNRSYANIPIIALTANASPANREACLEAGMSDFIDKPVSLPRMKDFLAEWAERLKSAD